MFAHVWCLFWSWLDSCPAVKATLILRAVCPQAGAGGDGSQRKHARWHSQWARALRRAGTEEVAV